MIDEAVFIIGPTVVDRARDRLASLGGSGVALVAGVVGTLALAAQRTHRARRRTRAGAPAGAAAADAVAPRACRWPWSALALGSLFGAAEVATVAFAGEQGAKSYAGVLLALWALGSLLAGLLTGTVALARGRRSSGSGRARARWPLVMLPLRVRRLDAGDGRSPCFVAGFAIAPTLIASMSLTEQVVPAAAADRGHGDHADRHRRRARARRRRSPAS